MKKNIRKALVLVLALCMVFSLAACGDKPQKPAESPASDTADTPAESEKITIGVTLMNFSTQFSIDLKDYMTAKAEEIGGVELMFLDAGGDAAKQVQQIDSFISQGVDAIIMQPQEQDACSPAVEKAKEAGIPIVNCNSHTTAEPDAYVGSDDAESAEIAMNYIAECLDGKGKVVMMHGHPGQTAELMRTQGAMDVLEKFPDMELLDEQTANWDRAEAMTLMENWLQAYGDEINAVFCQNDEMALGALNALLQAGKKDNVVVVGVDAIDDARKSVKEGELDATVFQDCKGQAEGALEAAIKLAKGEEVDAQILIPFILVNSENIDEYLK